MEVIAHPPHEVVGVLFPGVCCCFPGVCWDIQTRCKFKETNKRQGQVIRARCNFGNHTSTNKDSDNSSTNRSPPLSPPPPPQPPPSLSRQPSESRELDPASLAGLCLARSWGPRPRCVRRRRALRCRTTCGAHLYKKRVSAPALHRRYPAHGPRVSTIRGSP